MQKLHGGQERAGDWGGKDKMLHIGQYTHTQSLISALTEIKSVSLCITFFMNCFEKSLMIFSNCIWRLHSFIFKWVHWSGYTVPYTVFDQFILQGTDLETRDLGCPNNFFPCRTFRNI